MFAYWKFCWLLLSESAVAAVLSSRSQQTLSRRSVIAEAQQQQPQQQQQQGRHLAGHLLPQHLRAHNTKDLPLNRDLVWSDTPSGPCPDDILATLRKLDPTIFHCSTGTILWDEGGLLTAETTFYMGKEIRPNLFGGSYTTFYSETIRHGYYEGKQCLSIDACVYNPTADTSVALPGQYSYDCTNVYCGPNAARNCYGTYLDTICQVGNSSQTTIPLLRNVHCAVMDKWLATTASAEQCGACEEDDESLTTSITCEPQCLGCDSPNSCDIRQERVVFSELVQSVVKCDSKTGGAQFCVTYNAPSGLGARGDRTLFSCNANVDGVGCSSCSICGFKDNAEKISYTIDEVLFEADCTNVDNISRFNSCDRTASGGFEVYLEDHDPNTCQGQPAAPVDQMQPVVAPSVAMPLMTVTQPPSPPVAAPILQPTTVFRSFAPVTSPVVASATALAGTAPTGTLDEVPVAAPTPTPQQQNQTQLFSSSGKAFVSKCSDVVMIVGLFLWAGLL